jgi:hypothetical protein
VTRQLDHVSAQVCIYCSGAWHLNHSTGMGVHDWLSKPSDADEMPLTTIRSLQLRCSENMTAGEVVHRVNSGFVALFTTGGGPSVSGYGRGAPRGGRGNPEPLGGDVRCGDRGAGLRLSSWSGVFGGLGGACACAYCRRSSKLGRSKLTIESGRPELNCSSERRPGETNSPECRGCISSVTTDGNSSEDTTRYLPSSAGLV